MTPVFISIVCHNRLDLTRKCVKSVLLHSPEGCHLIITDNASSDGTSEYLATLPDHRCTILTNQHNLGFIAPHNMAYSMAKQRGADYFVVLNNDTVVDHNWLNNLLEPFQDPTMSITGAKGGCCTLGPNGVGYIGPKVDYIEGSCLCVRTSLVETLFSDDFIFAYFEDSDLSLRMIEAGYKIMLTKAQIRHERNQTASMVKEDVAGFKIRNQLVFMKKWSHLLSPQAPIIKGAPPKKEPPKNILVKRAGAIGDVILATPILRALKKKYPDHSIYVETKCIQALAGNEHITDYVLPTHPAREYSMMFDLNLAYENDPCRHIIDAYAAKCGLTLPTSEWSLDLYRPGRMRIPCDRYAVVNPGPTDWPGRNYPSDRFNEICKRLKQEGLETFVVGGIRKHDMKEATADLRGTTSFDDLCDVIGGASLFVGIDSMPMHVAQAFDVPLVAVFGCINPSYRLLPKEHFLGVTLPLNQCGCLGCHHLMKSPRTYSTCLRERVVCMEDLSADYLWSYIEKMTKFYTHGKRNQVQNSPSVPVGVRKGNQSHFPIPGFWDDNGHRMR